jgi:oxygen-dependent protoporphyrinogen oxidase
MIDVLVIGGGITGLSAAYEIERLGFRYALFESAARWGGKLTTERYTMEEQKTFVLDVAAESFITRKPHLWQLAHSLGLGDQLLALRSQTSGVHLLHQGQLYRIPLQPVAFLTSRLLTTSGKLRALAEPFVAPRRDEGDESLAEFARRRLGKEAATRLIEPILGSIYNADPEIQSVLVSSPHMRQLERQYGGLVRGMLATMFKRRQPDKPPAFFTVKDGVDHVVRALVGRLRGEMALNSPISSVRREGNLYSVVTADGRRLKAYSVILTTPANVTSDLLRAQFPDASAVLSTIQHASIGTAMLGFRSADVPQQPTLSSLIIPRSENRAIDAFVWTSMRVPQRAPDGYHLLKAFFGGAQPYLMTLDDGEVVNHVRAELRQWLDIEAAPVMSHISRWQNSFPQLSVGHLDRVKQARAALPTGLFVAGSSYEGVGVPDCIRQGWAAAAEVASFLSTVTIE